MKMQIDFYSKDEVSIEIDSTGRYPFPETGTSELFVFACYTLRQLKNLGQHLVAKALAGLLVSDDIIAKLTKNSVELPSGKLLLMFLNSYATSIVFKTRGLDESVLFSLELNKQLKFDKTMMEILDTEFLASKLRLVKYNGKGKKVFEVKMPPFSLHTEGFGLLGRDVNFYAFHSVIALIRFLGQKHSDDEVFLKHLVQVAQQCGSAYIFNQIPADQVELANTILKQDGIS